MKTVTLRVPDELADGVAAVAAARGVTLSDLIRSVLQTLVDPGEPQGDRGGRDPDVPESISTIDRHNTAMLHRILARLVDGSDTDGDRDYQLERAKIVESGFVSQYPDVFVALESELPTREADFVMDVLDMFSQLEWSVTQLSDGDRQTLGAGRTNLAEFGGFDAGSRREGRLLSYAQHLISQRKWERLADRFDAEHDFGDSHMKMADVYARMLAVHRPIWTERLRGFTRGDYALELADLIRITDAAPAPSVS